MLTPDELAANALIFRKITRPAILLLLFKTFHMVCECFWWLFIRYDTLRHVINLGTPSQDCLGSDAILLMVNIITRIGLPALPISTPLQQPLWLIKKVICSSVIRATCSLTTAAHWVLWLWKVLLHPLVTAIYLYPLVTDTPARILEQSISWTTPLKQSNHWRNLTANTRIGPVFGSLWRLSYLSLLGPQKRRKILWKQDMIIWCLFGFLQNHFLFVLL